MGFFSGEHPYTAVTAIINKIIENHTGESDDGTIELELPELLETIQMQKGSGSIEAARAIRKKLKYGSKKEQANALQILELLVANGGPKLSPLYNDQRLLDRFKLIVTDKNTYGPKLRRMAILMVIGWEDEYKGNEAYRGIANLSKQLPMDKFVKKKNTNSNKNKRKLGDFMNDEADESTPFEVIGGGTDTMGGNSSTAQDADADAEEEQEFYSSRNYKNKGSSRSDAVQSSPGKAKTNAQINREYKIPRINYVKEKPKIYQLIADSTACSTKLKNTLKTLHNDENPAKNKKCMESFLICRETRRKVLRYLQLVDHEEFLGSLIHSNEELIGALQEFSTISEKYENDDSESEYDYDSEEEEVEEDESVYTRPEYSSDDDDDESIDQVSKSMNNFKIPARAPPPIPPKSPKLKSPQTTTPSISTTLNNNNNNNNNKVVVQDNQEEEDEDDPFGDSKKTSYPVAWS